LQEAGKEGTLLPEAPAVEPTRRLAQRAKSVTLPSLDSLKPVTQRVQSAGASAAKAANSRDSLIHAQPPTFAQCWAEHAECAKHYEAALIRIPRYIWAAVHVGLVKPVCDLTQWVLFSPLRLAVLAVVVAVIYLLA
jgi:hypothetical protein